FRRYETGYFHSHFFLVRKYPVSYRRNESQSVPLSSTGYTITCPRGRRRPASRNAWHTTATSVPPELSPTSAMREGWAPSDAALSCTHHVAASASSTAAGNLCSGASR